ncbi:MAG: signal peptide peptidase SppA [Candidatus Sericytochromatia bacterium]|nr:signal peptide peptidase SppA [Candidatus Sericytochromatia bacterium]
MERLTAGVILLCCLITAIGNLASPAREQPSEERGFTDRMSFGRAGDLAEIEVVGGIMSRGSTGASSTRIVQSLRQAAKEKVKGILLTVDSPGGSAAASQEVFEEVRRIKETNHIPVVCSMGDIAASGGYYIAAAADEIVANRATLTGSIGVIMYMFNAKGLLDKIGVVPEVIKTGPFKDIGSPYRSMTPPERALLQSLINNTYDQFLGDVAKGRKMTVEQVKSLAGGQIYTGEQAKTLKLIDTLGSRTDAIRILGRRAGIKGDPKVKNYSRSNWSTWIDDIGLEGKAPQWPLTLADSLKTITWQAKVPLVLYDQP